MGISKFFQEVNFKMVLNSHVIIKTSLLIFSQIEVHVLFKNFWIQALIR